MPVGFDTPLTRTGLLAPGAYSLLLNAGSSVRTAPDDPHLTTSANFDFTFGLTPVTPTPEPSSLVLLSTGTLGGAWIGPGGCERLVRRHSRLKVRTADA